MSKYWGFRTSGKDREIVLRELSEGRLRQGWGWLPEQDLGTLGPLVEDSGLGSLSENQRATWRRCQRLWPGHWGRIEVDDYLVLPKLPEDGEFTLVRVTGNYKYEPIADGSTNDLRHMLPVEIVKERISNQNKFVQAGIQRSFRCQGPVWSMNGHASAVERILSNLDANLETADSDLVRLSSILQTLEGEMEKLLREEFRGNQLESPVLRLLESLFPAPARVEKKAGPGERGADFIVTETDPFGLDRLTVYQLKDWDGDASDFHALDQLETALEAWDAHSAVLLTSRSIESQDFQEARIERSQRIGKPIEFIGGNELAILILANISAISSK